MDVVYRLVIGAVLAATVSGAAPARADADRDLIYAPGHLKSVDSELKVEVGTPAPDFVLPSVRGPAIRLSDYRTRKNVVLSFVPAAWTPVCSKQWPGYDVARDLFEKHDTVLLGITVDNRPTLHAWIREMEGLWFPVLSDFWPHGSVAKRYGILRADGMTERALFVIDKQGIIRYIDVHDINERPELGMLIGELAKLQGP